MADYSKMYCRRPLSDDRYRIQSRFRQQARQGS
nr:MAG TPA: hypothetical protein [Caudoviricetes sp.]